MTLDELKQNLIDTYALLLRIKSTEKDVNEELDKALKLYRIKLQAYSIDISELDNIFLPADV